MKRMLSFSALAWLICLISCTKDPGAFASGSSKSTLCNYSPAFNADFLKIGPDITYDSLFRIFLTAGNNYRTDVTNIDTIEYYRWYPCSDTANYYIECQLESGELLTAFKTFSDTACAANVTAAGYDSLHIGMTMSQVQTVLNGYGDNFRNDYNLPGNSLKTASFRFTACGDTSAHIVVLFSPVSGVTSVSRTF